MRFVLSARYRVFIIRTHIVFHPHLMGLVAGPWRDHVAGGPERRGGEPRFAVEKVAICVDAHVPQLPDERRMVPSC